MIWDDGKIIFDIILKTASLGAKRSIQTDGIGPWPELRVPYGEDFEVKNGGLRLAPVFGTFFLIYQYHNLAQPEIRATLVMMVVMDVTVLVAVVVEVASMVRKVVRQRYNCLTGGWFYYIFC